MGVGMKATVHPLKSRVFRAQRVFHYAFYYNFIVSNFIVSS